MAIPNSRTRKQAGERPGGEPSNIDATLPTDTASSIPPVLAEETPRAVEDVFGLSRQLPLNYVQRDKVDDAFYQALGRKKHIVVYGSSKQGKTCLCRQTLSDGSYVRIACQSSWTLSHLHAAILKATGYVVEQSTTKALSGDYKLSVKLSGKVKGPGAELAGSVEQAAGSSASIQTVETRLELDASDVNDVISALQQLDFNEIIVLEDFHYLSKQAQAEFAAALKAFYDGSSVQFIIVGVWLDPNRLIHYNRDLSGRITTINADTWTREQLESVIRHGADLLNIEFESGFVTTLLNGCHNSVWIAQEVCYMACQETGIDIQQQKKSVVGSSDMAKRAISHVVNTQSAQYMHFIKAFTENADAATRDIYRWLLAAILISNADVLQQGIHLKEVYEFIYTASNEQEIISLASLEMYLGNHLAWYQTSTLHVNPIILDFDRTRKVISITDRGFLMWIASQDRVILLAEADVPVGVRISPEFRDSRPGGGRHRAAD